MPKRLDFTSKKLHHEYLCSKTLAKKVLECFDGLEVSVKVNKVLMWMGPKACVKHELHPFPPGDKEKLTPLWNFFDNLCSKKGRLPRIVERRENDTEVHETGERRVSGHFLRTDT